MKKIVLMILCVVVCLASMPTVCFAAPKKVVAQANVVNGGDLLISKGILDNSKTASGYNFDYIFQHVDDYVKAADYAVINLETSIGGKKIGYSGFPRFNTPESIVTSAKKAGFDMFLNASNHSYDLGYNALLYKINVLNNKGVDFIGIRKDTTKALHKVVNINGIKVGMLNYTKESWISTEDRVVLNRFRSGADGEWEDVIVDKKAAALIGRYHKNKKDEFYQCLEKDITKLKNKGAELIVVYPHWGTQYHIGIEKLEDDMAQKMCDMGVDVIVGGHPHVVEPVKVYTSEVSGKTMVCIHSTGNFVSSMSPTTKKYDNARYTRDGALFSFTIKKYSDGSVAVTDAEVLPIYVYKNTKKKYMVIPLEKGKDWSKYGIAKYAKKKAGYYSYHRTKNLTDEGINQFNAMPKISKQPVSCKVKTGKNAVYSISAVGKNLKYQWQYSTDNGTTWKKVIIDGYNTPKLTIKAADFKNGRLFRCRVKNGAGIVFSKPAKITVD